MKKNDLTVYRSQEMERESSLKYVEYLKGERWRALRSAKLSEKPYCECCGRRKGLNVHHLTYRRGWGKEKLSDLMTLCGRCHQLIHQKLASGELVIKEGQGVWRILKASRDYLRITLEPGYWPKRKKYNPRRVKKIIERLRYDNDYPIDGY